MIVITEKLKLLVKKNPSSCERLNECIDILKNRLELFEPEGKKFLRSALLSETIKQESLVLGFGNPYLRDDYALKLSSVLEDLHKHFSRLSGLFSPAPKYRGKWATSWIVDLANIRKGVADGIAYEVLAAKRILLENMLGFKIDKDDYCSFCFKLQASYPGSSRQLNGQPNRTTVESDLQIFVSKRGWEVGIDFKHTSNKRPIRLSKQQIAGVVIALKTGEIDQFWFVSNLYFSKISHSIVKSLNEELKSTDVTFDDPLNEKLMDGLNVTQEDIKRYNSPSKRIGLLEYVCA